MNRKSKVISTNRNAAFDRTSTLVLEVTSYGTSDQHLQTIDAIVKEIDLRGFNVKVVDGRH